jgi:hypothetical protein
MGTSPHSKVRIQCASVYGFPQLNVHFPHSHDSEFSVQMEKALSSKYHLMIYHGAWHKIPEGSNRRTTRFMLLSCLSYTSTLKKLAIHSPEKSVYYHRTTQCYVRFEVFTAVTMKNGVFWDVTPCGSCKKRRFGGT